MFVQIPQIYQGDRPLHLVPTPRVLRERKEGRESVRTPPSKPRGGGSGVPPPPGAFFGSHKTLPPPPRILHPYPHPPAHPIPNPSDRHLFLITRKTDPTLTVILTRIVNPINGSTCPVTAQSRITDKPFRMIPPPFPQPPSLSLSLSL